jgi:Uma2 family endonuclease
MGAEDIVIARPSPAELEARFLQVMADPRFADLGPWELNDNGEVIVSPPSAEHGRAQAVLCAELERQLGDRAWIEQALRRPDGAPLVPDVLWANTDFFEANKRLGMLSSAPRLCVEVVSPWNTIERLRGKSVAYLQLGAEEVWIVDPVAKRAEIHAPEGRRSRTVLAFDLDEVWSRL